ISIDVSSTEETMHIRGSGAGGGGPARKFEDATDMEETFVEKGRAFSSPRGLRAVRTPMAPPAADPSRPILDPDDGETLTPPPADPSRPILDPDDGETLASRPG